MVPVCDRMDCIGAMSRFILQALTNQPITVYGVTLAYSRSSLAFFLLKTYFKKPKLSLREGRGFNATPFSSSSIKLLQKAFILN